MKWEPAGVLGSGSRSPTSRLVHNKDLGQFVSLRDVSQLCVHSDSTVNRQLFLYTF